MRALIAAVALLATTAQAQQPTHLYRSGFGIPEARIYVALFLQARECETVATLWNASQSDLRFWCEAVQ